MLTFDYDGDVIMQQRKLLEDALSSNPKTQKALQGLVRRVIKEARSKIVGNIEFDNGDPRHAAHAVRTVVYRKILGGNVNIYPSHKAHAKGYYEPPRVLRPGQ